MQPGIIYHYLSILKAEQLALIEGKELWVVAGTVYISGLELANTHSNGATMRLRGIRYSGFWTKIKLGSQMSLCRSKTAVVNPRKCKLCKKSIYKTKTLNI